MDEFDEPRTQEQTRNINTLQQLASFTFRNLWLSNNSDSTHEEFINSYKTGSPQAIQIFSPMVWESFEELLDRSTERTLIGSPLVYLSCTFNVANIRSKLNRVDVIDSLDEFCRNIRERWVKKTYPNSTSEKLKRTYRLEEDIVGRSHILTYDNICGEFVLEVDVRPDDMPYKDSLISKIFVGMKPKNKEGENGPELEGFQNFITDYLFTFDKLSWFIETDIDWKLQFDIRNNGVEERRPRTRCDEYHQTRFFSNEISSRFIVLSCSHSLRDFAAKGLLNATENLSSQIVGNLVTGIKFVV